MISIQVVVYVYHNVGIESYTIMLTVGVIILEHPMSGIVLKLFRPAKSDSHQDWTIVCWHNEAGDWTQ